MAAIWSRWAGGIPFNIWRMEAGSIPPGPPPPGIPPIPPIPPGMPGAAGGVPDCCIGVFADAGSFIMAKKAV